MAGTGNLANWDRKAVNTWWQRGIDKERKRLTNAPKSPPSDPYSTPTNFSNFAPPLRPFKKPHAR